MEHRAELNHAQIKVEALCNVKGTGEDEEKKAASERRSLTKNQWMKGEIPAAFVWDY